MLKIFFGTDTIGVREAAFSAAGEAGDEVARLEAELYEAGQLAELAGSSSLFGGNETYLLDTPSANNEFFDELLALAPELATSAHTFVVIEGTVLAPVKKKLQPHANTFEELKAIAAERFNTFAMADALARKDKKSLWLLLQDARAASIAAEEIIGVLWWQLKTLRLAALTNNASEAGLKDFPYNKAKRALATFKSGELETISHTLITLYHDGHAGRRDIDLALERFVLTL